MAHEWIMNWLASKPKMAFREILSILAMMKNWSWMFELILKNTTLHSMIVEENFKVCRQVCVQVDMLEEVKHVSWIAGPIALLQKEHQNLFIWNIHVSNKLFLQYCCYISRRLDFSRTGNKGQLRRSLYWALYNVVTTSLVWEEGPQSHQCIRPQISATGPGFCHASHVKLVGGGGLLYIKKQHP